MNPSRKTFLKGCATGAVLVVLLTVVGGLGSIFLFKEAFIRYKEKDLKPPPIPYGEKADYGWSVIGQDGKTVEMPTFQGKPMFLQFWHPECAICVSELETVNRLYDRVQPLDVAFLCVTWSDKENLDKAVAARGVRFPVYRLNGARPPVFQSEYTPSTYIVAANGDVVFKYLGGAQWDAEVVFNYLLSLTQPAPSG